MTKTNIKTPILQRTVLVLAMSAISFPSYSLGSGDDDYTFADEGQVIIDNRDRSQGNSNWINTNDPFIQELKDLQNNPQQHQRYQLIQQYRQLRLHHLQDHHQV